MVGGCVHYKHSTLFPKLCIYSITIWITEKHCIAIWAKNTISSSGGRKQKIHRLHYKRYAIVCPPFCFFNPPFCKPSVLWSRKHLFATYPAPYGCRLSTLTPPFSKHYNRIHYWVGPLPHIIQFLYQLNYSYQSQEANINSKINKIAFSLYT